MFKEYDCFNLKQQARLFVMIVKAYCFDRSKDWFELWNHHNALGGPDELLEGNRAYQELGDYYYRQIFRRASNFKDFHLCLKASFSLKENEDVRYALDGMVNQAKGYEDWVLIRNLSPFGSEMNEFANQKICEGC
ncbi:MAG: hypothetical protein PHW52_04425 [Candidatus Pacebacteria bacterium]|nr:hypothetical protein [Candidatus Paceibacterota bacterium]